MSGRALPVVLALLLAGCVAPGADLEPSSLGLLDAIALEGATSEVLANGDRVLTLVGEVAGVEEFEFEVPAGTTYVEAVATGEERPVNVALRNAQNRARMCMPQSWIGWNQLADERRCTAIAAMDPGQKWLLQVSGGVLNGGEIPDPLGLLPVDDPTARPAEPAPYTVRLTFSAQPLDGTAALLKLDALSKPVFAAQETFSEKVAASADGALLNVEVTLPDAPGPFPTVMMASPYVSAERALVGRAHDAAVQYWTARGYAFVTMDLRGTGTSGGCYSGRGALDQTDTADAVEWVAAQEWSDGKIGMTGFSYVGFTPVAAAVQQPPHLTTIYIGGAAVDMWSNYRPGGVETGRTGSTMVLGYAYGNAAQTTPDENPLGPVQYRADAFCDPTIFQGFDPRNLYDAWWAERNLTELAGKIQVPVALEQGFWDNNVKSNYVPDFFNALEVPKRGTFGSWQHIWAYRADQALRVQAWMDHWLKGIDTGIMDTPVVEVITNTGGWRAADAWPALAPTYTDVPLEDGEFLTFPPVVPNVAPGDDAAETTTEPLQEDLYLSGVALIDMTVSVSNGGTALLEARLLEETPEGDVLLAGVGWMNAAHREGHDAWAPLGPGEAAPVQMKLLPQDHVFQKGSKLIIRIGSATDTWGGPDSAVNAPGLVRVSDATLRVPTLPVETLGERPRSAS